MITNPLLEAKYEAQKRLALETNHDLQNYNEIFKRTRLEIKRKYGLTFRYAKNFLD